MIHSDFLTAGTAVSASLVVGIPRALGSSDSLRMWQTFFARLGCTVILSRPAARPLLEAGAVLVPQGCPAAQAAVGQALELALQADIIALPDDLCARAGDVSPVLTKRLGENRLVPLGDDGRFSSAERLARATGRTPAELRSAYLQAFSARERMLMEAAAEQGPSRPAVALLGPRCVLRDSLLSLGVRQALQAAGYAAHEPADETAPVPGHVFAGIRIRPPHCENAPGAPGTILESWRGLPCLVLNAGPLEEPAFVGERLAGLFSLLRAGRGVSPPAD